MKTRKKQAVKYVTRYGAALCSLSLAPHAGAAIVDLSGNLPGPLAFASLGNQTGFDLLGDGGFDISANNNAGAKTINAIAPGGGLTGMGVFPFSSTITTGKSFLSGVIFGPSQAGTLTVGFLTDANQVGWIKINFGGAGGPITYLSAAFNDTPRGTIHAGTLSETASEIPEPSTTALTGLGLLALGAAGVRRRRKLQAAQKS